MSSKNACSYTKRLGARIPGTGGTEPGRGLISRLRKEQPKKKISPSTIEKEGKARQSETGIEKSAKGNYIARPASGGEESKEGQRRVVSVFLVERNTEKAVVRFGRGGGGNLRKPCKNRERENHSEDQQIPIGKAMKLAVCCSRGRAVGGRSSKRGYSGADT